MIINWTNLFISLISIEHTMAKYLLSLLFIVSTLLSYAAFAAPGGYASPVAIDTVQVRQMAPQVWVTGEVMSRHHAQIPSQVDGVLTWLVEVGSRVERGGRLARIDMTLLQQQLTEQQAIVDREQARLDYLIQETQRLESLVRQRNVSQSQLELTIADQAVARGDLAVAKARIAQVEEQLGRSEILAPFSGVVTQQLLQVGEWADSGKPVVVLVNTEELEIRAWVTEQVLPHIDLGEILPVKGGADSDSAELITIVPVGERQSRLYEIRLLPEKNWSVGQSVRVAVPTAKAEARLSAPRDALVLRRDGSYLFRVAEDNTAQRIPVTTGVAMGRYIQVSGQLAEGDQVVTNGGERLRPGQSVKVISNNGMTQ